MAHAHVAQIFTSPQGERGEAIPLGDFAGMADAVEAWGRFDRAYDESGFRLAEEIEIHDGEISSERFDPRTQVQVMVYAWTCTANCF